LNLNTLLFGRRLSNREHEDKKLGWIEAVPAMGLDGLGSSSYGPEAALTILIPLGALGLVYLGPVMGSIIALLVILYLSYRQTLAAYPSSGGAYVVAKENLGEYPSLLAAAALMIDYVLNVAVGVSAGVGEDGSGSAVAGAGAAEPRGRRASRHGRSPASPRGGASPTG